MAILRFTGRGQWEWRSPSSYSPTLPASGQWGWWAGLSGEAQQHFLASWGLLAGLGGRVGWEAPEKPPQRKGSSFQAATRPSPVPQAPPFPFPDTVSLLFSSDPGLLPAES